MSKLLNYKREGGHSLASWGETLGIKKEGQDITDFSKITPELINRCWSDLEIGIKTYFLLQEKFDEYPVFARSLDVEHKLAFICLGMHLDGFRFDIDGAVSLLADVKARLEGLDRVIQTEIRPKTRLVREITPRLTKTGLINRADFRWYKGNDYSIFQEGCPFSTFEWIEFNPASPKQVVDLLNKAGWKPINKTDGHLDAEKTGINLDHFLEYGWKVDETNLATLPDDAPESCKCLVERLLLNSRKTSLESWISLYRPNTKTIHGNFNEIGTWTHRMSHRDPNMGNIATEKSIKYKTKKLYDMAVHYGGEMRKLWIADNNYWLVGCDADQIQLRVLAHYLNDNKFTNALINGRKEYGTDLHTLNQKALAPHCRTRDQAKTFIYAFLLGAGVAKIASILNCSLEEARRTLQRFISYYPGLRSLKEVDIPRDARNGYFKGLDGRYIVCDSEHHMLAGYLQGGEAVIMKHANCKWRKDARSIGLQFRQVNFIHDEWQTYSLYKEEEKAHTLGELQTGSIAYVSMELGLRCPMVGNYRVGKSWHDTH